MTLWLLELTSASFPQLPPGKHQINDHVCIKYFFFFSCSLTPSVGSISRPCGNSRLPDGPTDRACNIITFCFLCLLHAIDLVFSVGPGCFDRVLFYYTTTSLFSFSDVMGGSFVLVLYHFGIIMVNIIPSQRGPDTTTLLWPVNEFKRSSLLFSRVFFSALGDSAGRITWCC